MSYRFYTDLRIEEPFFLEMASLLDGKVRAGSFNGNIAFKNCRCPGCGRKVAVMGYIPSADTFMLACPVDSRICALSGISLHSLIKQYGGDEMFSRWREARWTYVHEWLPLKSRRQGVRGVNQKKSFKEKQRIKSQSLEIRVRGKSEEG